MLKPVGVSRGRHRLQPDANATAAPRGALRRLTACTSCCVSSGSASVTVARSVARFTFTHPTPGTMPTAISTPRTHHAQLKPKAGDCCVYCSYGTVPCPPIQERGKGTCCGSSAG